MRNQGEPSVEEILESIKKVIARDNREAIARADAPANAPADDDEEEHLTQPDDDGILDLGHEDELVDRDEDGAEPAVDDDALTNEVSARSMRESLAALAMISEPSAKPQIVRSGETSLEGLVREMLRPMLAQWLDDNLPDMVERLVKAEISRIAHKQG